MTKKIITAFLFVLINLTPFTPCAVGEVNFSDRDYQQSGTSNQNNYDTPLSKREESWNQPVKPFKIIGNVYYVGASDVTAYLIATPQGHILLDSGFAQTVPLIKASMAEFGFKLSDIKILLNGHAHYDHCGGLAALKELTGAKFMTMAEDVEILANGGKGDFSFGDDFKFRPVKTDRVLHDGDKVELGGVTIIAHHTPGHTKGCTTWTMKVKEGERTYDVVFAGSASVPGHQLVDNPKYPNIVEDYEKTFRKLKTLPCDIFLAQHGSFFDLKTKVELLAKGTTVNPFNDPKGYKNYIQHWEKNFQDELRKQQQAKANRK